MLNTYTYPEFPYQQSKEQQEGHIKRHPLVIIGAGPIGLTAALDAAAYGIPAVVLDDNNTVSIGSRAVCYAKRPLEIWDRLEVAQPMVDKGINWKVGKTFFKDKLAYEFDLLPEEGHKMPAMINLQQYYLEEYLVERCNQLDNVDLRWKHRLLTLEQKGDHVLLTVETPDGIFKMEADWVLACDGANSDTREMVGGVFKGQFFQDRFLIADVVMKGQFPTERWFWFDPPFHPNQSVLLHKQADDVWRIDFQLGWDADPEEAKKPENVLPLLKQMLGEDSEFELEWISVYQFACRRMDQFRYNRVLFAGDAAHQVSPFGARGANTGVQDIDNLFWKLKLVMDGKAPLALLDTYSEERVYAADDNLKNSTRSTDFITPKSKSSKIFRDAVLELAEKHDFARPLVNSGRLSTPTPYLESSLNTADEEAFAGKMQPGTNCADAPIKVQGQDAWLLNQLGEGFQLMVFGDAPQKSVEQGGVSAQVIQVGQDFEDSQGLVTQRYDGQPGTVYLLRPDQHVAARWRQFDASKIKQALAKATCQY
ncbi:3-(3-hydroxy-phenyl)propionate hydroxylase [Marinospirillum celere]|uniref:3-(3-hydroxy-phenyl)propionate hydroxylase n=1 Tax=Marinospirillum celere TaxID=1122252 RepID=A0A1I1FNF1_9GAMM|nr:FAD-dependent oxidoreductase [Marinospirillum celere]SFC00947.1 3-(3-hydroxy-phenyl)propionate hydroxylase [Marinospirillum celere]